MKGIGWENLGDKASHNMTQRPPIERVGPIGGGYRADPSPQGELGVLPG